MGRFVGEHPHSPHNGVVSGGPIITTPVIRVSKDGRKVKTRSGNWYRLRFGKGYFNAV